MRYLVDGVPSRNPFNQVTSKKSIFRGLLLFFGESRNPFNQVTSKKCGEIRELVIGHRVVIPLIRSQVKNPIHRYFL